MARPTRKELTVLSLESEITRVYRESRSRDPQDTLALALERIRGVAGYETVAFYRPMRVAPGELIEHPRSPILLPWASSGSTGGLVERILPESESIVRRAYDAEKEQFGAGGLAVPVRDQSGRNYGVLYVSTDGKGRKARHELGKDLARHAATELGAWNDFFHERDQQTGALSNIQLLRDMPLYIRDAQESEGLLGMIYIDGNGIKTINLKYGRETGTEWIKLLGNGLAHVLGTDALLYRRGDSSDEFVIMLPQHSRDEAAKYEEGLMERVVGYMKTHLEGTRVAQMIPSAELERFLKMPYSSTALELHHFLGSREVAEWARVNGFNLETTTPAGLGNAFVNYGDHMVQERKIELGIRR